MDENLPPQDQSKQAPAGPAPKPAKGGYGKKPAWFWIVVYLVVGAIVYFLVYYFVFADRSSGSLY